MYMLKVISPLRTACSRMMETTAHLRYSLRLKTTMPPPKRVIVEPLAERELLRVSGDEAVPFLQGLVTNDMDRLKSAPPTTSMYAMFLNKSGRVMYDTIIYRTENQSSYIIECDKNVSDDLRRHLRMHRVRRKIDIDSLHKQFRPWIAFNPDSETALQAKRTTPEIFSSMDPRLTGLGLRMITSIDKKWVDVAKPFEKIGEVSVTGPSKDCDYRTHRYRYGIGEGVQDLPPGKCFPLEANCDFLHGVSFNKGCYLGQELTARSYHTGVIRKRLMPLRLTTQNPPKATTVQTLAGANIGTVRGISLNRALALLRVEQVLNLAELMIDGEACYAEKPKWWPSEMARKAAGSENY